MAEATEADDTPPCVKAATPEVEAALNGYVPPVRHEKPGRPQLYDEAIAWKLCELLGDNGKLHEICKQPDMPSAATVYAWLAKYPEFRVAYSCALYAKFDARSEECIQIADDASKDFEEVPGEDGITIKAKPEAIERTKLRLAERHRQMAKDLPRKYADMAVTQIMVTSSAALPGEPEAVQTNGEPKLIEQGPPLKPEQHPLAQSIVAWRAARKD